MVVTSLPLRRVIDAKDLADLQIDPEPVALGSFWVESNRDVQSRIVKYFKHPEPPLTSNAAAQALLKAYAGMIVERLGGNRPDSIVRILASRETRPAPSAPLSVLASSLGSTLIAPVIEPFYRSDSRKSMRDVERLSGPDALKPRIEYVLQDLFIIPQPVPGKVLLLDDIYNLGASVRVYSEALKRFCQTDTIWSFNLAVTRFHGGKDGWGYLPLDVDKLMKSMSTHLPESERGLAEIILISDKTIHTEGCPESADAQKMPRFLAPSDSVPCPVCHKPVENRPWWKRMFSHEA